MWLTNTHSLNILSGFESIEKAADACHRRLPRRSFHLRTALVSRLRIRKLVRGACRSSAHASGYSIANASGEPAHGNYTLHGWDLDVSGVIRLLHCFSPREWALLHSAAALAPRGLRAKVKLPTQAMSNTHPRGVYDDASQHLYFLENAFRKPDYSRLCTIFKL